MAKNKSYYLCSVCGQQEAQWQGRCRKCGSWNTFAEQGPEYQSPAGGVRTALGNRASGGVQPTAFAPLAIPLAEVSIPQVQRLGSGFGELDRVLGGGLVPGSSILLGGEPGVGKSTLLLQIAARLPQQVLYVSAEESAAQVKIRAQRLGCEQSPFCLLCSNQLGDIASDLHARMRTKTQSQLQLLIVDSLQTVLETGIGAVPGTPSQLRHITQVLQDCCREYQLAVLLVAHLTKDGSIAGPRTVEHQVDCVVYFEHGEHDLRLLQASKNRFGPTSEIGILEMSATGLQELDSPQQYFLSQRGEQLPAGIAIAPVYEGSRSLLVELQALTVPAKGSVSRIFADRLDNARVSRIAAVLERHTGIVFSDQDIYINVAGGLRLQDVAIDLPLALALLSARLGRPLPPGLVAAAELSLAGELRPIKHEEQRQRSAADCGLRQLILPPLPSSHRETDQDMQPQTAQISDLPPGQPLRLWQIAEVLQTVFGVPPQRQAEGYSKP